MFRSAVLKEGWKNAFSSFSFHSGYKRGFSSFQALSTAVAAQVGTGNIIGASGAILTGGPGAIFWMWVIAFFSMATSYAEAVLAQETREKDHNGVFHGGPLFYINRAFPNFFGRFLGGISRIASVTEKIVPLMAILYIIGCLDILIYRYQYIQETFAVIFKYAFMPENLLGSSFGTALKIAVSQGVKRGLFSNEAGMGSTPHAHAIAALSGIVAAASRKQN